MKRLALVLSIVFVLAAGGVAAMRPDPDRAAAQDGERLLPMTVSTEIGYVEGEEEDYQEEGASCYSFHPQQSDLVGVAIQTGLQVIVRDQNDAIVAMHTLRGTIEVGPINDSERFCRDSFEMTLPSESTFYTLWIGDTYIRGFEANEFPIDPEVGGPYVSIS